MNEEASAAGALAPRQAGGFASIAPPAERLARYAIVDAARGAALVAMILYHFTWDLDFFSLIPGGVIASVWFKDLGHAIAAGFLVLVGVSLALAARAGFCARAFFRRLAVIVAAALLITAATWIVFPHEYIFFGILHCIAVASLAAAAFLRAPVKLVIAAAVVAVALPLFVSLPALNAPAAQWIGLGTREPVTNDWAPFLPAFGYVLFGLAGARLALSRSLPAPLAAWKPRRLASRLLARGGRRSLLVYLGHQPILLAVLFVATALAGRSRPSEAASFVSHCSTQCVARGAARTYCERACGCVATRTETTSLWSDVLENQLSPDERTRFNAIARLCTSEIGAPR